MLRSEISDEYKWDLRDIVDGDGEWENIFSSLSKEYTSADKYKGKLNNADNIYDCLKEQDGISLVIEKLYVYAKMKLDEDAGQSVYQGMVNRIEMLSVKLSSLTSYVMPELSALDNEFLHSLKADDRFGDYSYFIENLIRNKAHVLSENEEKILSEVRGFSDGFHDAFNMFDNADVVFKPITDKDGAEIEMSHGVYGSILQGEDRDLRRQAFKSMFEAYKTMNNTLTQLYSGNVKKNIFFAKSRGFDSAIERAAFNENTPIDIYYKLLENVENALPLMHEYVNLRKEILDVDELHCYDLHTPLIKGAGLNLCYEDACKLVKSALKPLGDEYSALLDRAFGEHWIDVYENKGKRSGAYSWGSYGTHPYVLLNYQPVTHDVFTIAHELGHAMHSYYSNLNQPYPKAGYEIFVAEVASTVNEVLLLKYLIKDSDKETKKFLTSYYLDMFRTTLFRQTQFASFEEKAHKLAESDIPLTSDTLNDVYYNLNKTYYGDGLVQDELIKYEWSRIPHFYRSFYVYKYATGLTSAVSIAKRILEDGDDALDKYMKFLTLGGSMPPSDELKTAGVDLMTDEPYKACIDEFGSTLSELRKLFD